LFGVVPFFERMGRKFGKKNTARSWGLYTLTKPVAMAFYPKQEEASLSKGHF
jgi:hypothetical protein